jgi:hypothetical protein
LAEGVVNVLSRLVGLSVVDCGQLWLPSGQVLYCDPFTELEIEGPVLSVPPGRYSVRLTLADMSGQLDGSELAEAFLSLVLVEGGEEASHRPLVSQAEGKSFPNGVELNGDTVAVVDAEAFKRCMPPPEEWEEEVFEGGREPWYELLDDPELIRAGVANVILPLAQQGENAILCHAALGEGNYPVVGSYDASGRLLAVHLDFQLM